MKKLILWSKQRINLTNQKSISSQAYPEYLVTYQIVKPEDSSSGNEESSRWWIANITKRHRSATQTTKSTRTNLPSHKYMIITPVVSIDRGEPIELTDQFYTDTNCNVRTKRHAVMKLLPSTTACVTGRWCAFFCSAVRCFGNNNTPRGCSLNSRATTTIATAGNNCNGCQYLARVTNAEPVARDSNRNVIYELWPCQFTTIYNRFFNDTFSSFVYFLLKVWNHISYYIMNNVFY